MYSTPAFTKANTVFASDTAEFFSTVKQILSHTHTHTHITPAESAGRSVRWQLCPHEPHTELQPWLPMQLLHQGGGALVGCRCFWYDLRVQRK